MQRRHMDTTNQSNLIMGLALIVTGLIGLCLFAQPIYAQDKEAALLRQKIEELEIRIEQLEEQLRECMDFNEKVAAGEFGWQNRKNWRSLRVGMPEQEVKAILGEPSKIIRGVKTLWYYPNIYEGFVSFDQNGNLAGWNEP
jgi:hypothetical protein